MANERLGRQDRRGSLDAPSVVALAALQKRGKNVKELPWKRSI